MDKVERDRGAQTTTEKEVPGEDVFDKEFETAITEDIKADLPAAEKPEVAVEKPVVKETSEKPAQKPDETDETDTQRYKTLQGIHKHDKAAWETEKAALLSQLEEAKKPKPAEKEVPAEKKKPDEDLADLLTEEEKKQLEEYEKDFETVTRMEGLKRKVEMARMQKVLDSLIEDVNKRLEEQGVKLTEQGTKMEPVIRKAEITTTEEHFGAIKEAHPDYEKYRDDGSIVKWIESRPKYLQVAMLEAYEKGTAEDVAQLISDFKEANNIQTEAESGNEKVVPMDKKKKEKREALAAVETRRGAVNSAQSLVDDFESAFDEALHK